MWILFSKLAVLLSLESLSLQSEALLGWLGLLEGWLAGLENGGRPADL